MIRNWTKCYVFIRTSLILLLFNVKLFLIKCSMFSRWPGRSIKVSLVFNLGKRISLEIPSEIFLNVDIFLCNKTICEQIHFKKRKSLKLFDPMLMLYWLYYLAIQDGDFCVWSISQSNHFCFSGTPGSYCVHNGLFEIC